MRFVMIALFMLGSVDALAADAKTDRAWRGKCGSCHGEDGKAQTEQGKKMLIADMTTAAWQKKFSDDQIKAAITNGVNETRGGTLKLMTAYKSQLRPDQITDLTAFIRTLGK